MGELAQKFLQAQQDVAAAKAQKVDGIAEAKERAFNVPSNPDFLSENLSNTVQDTGEFLDQTLSSPGRIVEQNENVILRQDGTIDVIAHDGSILSNIRPEFVPQTVAREQAKAADIASGAADNNFIEDSATILGQGFTGLSKQFAKGLVGLGNVQTLPQAVERNNKLAQDRRLNIKGDIKHISPGHLDAYTKIKQLRQSGQPLSAAQKAFAASDTFASIFNLEAEVREGRELISRIDEGEKQLNKYIPTTRADEVSMQLAFQRVSENEGTLAALQHTFVNDFDTMARAGFGSIPYMIAFTMGGPIAQTSILTLLSKGKASELTSEFEKTHNRSPSAQEQVRIDAFAAVSTIAEKAGDMVAVGILNRVKIPRILNTKKILESVLPESVKTVLRSPLIASSVALGNLAGRAVRRPGIALAGEGASGALSSASDQLALSGEITDSSQIAFDALAEAVGTVGGLSGILAGRTAESVLRVGKDTLDAVRASARESGGAASTDATSTPPPSPVDGNIILKDTEPVVTERIEVSKFDKAVDDIKEAFNDATPEGIQKAFFALSRLARRELTEDQAEKHKKTLVEGIKKFEDLSTREQEGGILGSLGPIDELSADDLQELATNKDATEADRAYIDSIVEAQELADELTSENIQDTDKADTTATIQSFNNILKEIQGISTDPSFSTAETKAARTDSLISQLGTQLTNVQNKLAAVIKASKFTPEAGAVTAIQATRVNPQDPNDLTIDFSDPISLTEAQLIAEQEQLEAGDSIIRVLPDSASQIELLNKEVQFGEKIVELASIHGDTSFARSTAHQQAVQRLAADAAKQLSALKPPTISSEKVEKEIDKIKDPIKGESKETSKPETKEPVKKSLAQEFINPTESSDIAVKNRKVWENIPVEVVNKNGTTTKILAGKLWDGLHEKLEMVTDLLVCVKK